MAPYDKYYYHITTQRANKTENESVQDISAETVAYYTKMLAWFTGALAFVSCLQICLLVQGARAGREQATEMKKASGLAETQNAIIAAQTDIQGKQHELSRFQFYAAQRPKLVIRSLVLRQFETGKEIIVDMVIANTGTSEAQIVEGNVTIAIPREGRLPPIPPYDVDRLFLLNMVFQGGRKHPIIKTREVPLQVWEWDCVEAPPFGGRLFLFGFFTYEDGVGNRREMGFGRVFDPGIRRFVVYEDQNYEYAD
jgi:hypothetical protein